MKKYLYVIGFVAVMILSILIFSNINKPNTSEITQNTKNSIISDLLVNPIKNINPNVPIDYNKLYPDTSKEVWLSYNDSNYIAHIYERTNEFGVGISVELFQFKDGNIQKQIDLFGFKGTFDEAKSYLSRLNISDLQLCSDLEVNCQKKPIKDSDIFTGSYLQSREQKLASIKATEDRKASIPKLCGDPNIAELLVKNYGNKDFIVPRKVEYQEFMDCYKATYNADGEIFWNILYTQVQAGKIGY